ncbi:helix-turn-helix domain-containing protein [Bittarella massiliensis (ex Durand et al. 2017)]|uniref:helix-turn-helix domain-containing protein n=1 Tax=Bittarella massiliensis (ex Durand et al. 2017) TaxID=1720313 RepID=UPI001AA14FE4|nr:helix-turn-helix transcriptional regulator [Bittarella massiliensis (ex Durand et al. 2017)]
MNDRIRQLRRTLGMNQEKFAAAIGLRQGTVSHLEKKGTTVTEQNVKAICAQFGASEGWLRTGHGEMFLPGQRQERELLAAFGQLAPPLQNYLVQSARELLKAQLEMAGDGAETPIK